MEKLSPKWKLLATKLRLRNHAVENIQENCSDVMSSLNEALKEWLKLNYNHPKYGRPSWRRLAEAVRSLDYGIFEVIARNHAGEMAHSVRIDCLLFSLVCSSRCVTELIYSVN